jgi:hypothetical protein
MGLSFVTPICSIGERRAAIDDNWNALPTTQNTTTNNAAVMMSVIREKVRIRCDS